MTSGPLVGTASSALICQVRSISHIHGLGVVFAFLSLHSGASISQHWDISHKLKGAVECAQVSEPKEATMATLSEFYTRGCERCGGEVEVWIFSESFGQPLQFLRCKQIACALNTSRNERAEPIGVDQRFPPHPACAYHRVGSRCLQFRAC